MAFSLPGSMVTFKLAALCPLLCLADARLRGSESLVKQGPFTKTNKTQTSIEYVAQQPASGHNGSPLQWVEVSYPTTVTSASDVQFSDVTGSDSTDVELYIGALNALPLGDSESFALTAKLFGEHLYGYISTGAVSTISSGGCCAGTMRKYSKSSGNYTDIDLTSPLQMAFRDKDPSTVAATHTFDITEFNGQVFALLMVQYLESEINGLADAFVALSMEDGITIQQTIDGDEYFSLYDNLGTLSTDARSSIYKIQYYNNSGGKEAREQWHGNGIQRFSTANGTAILAFTQRTLGSATLLSDPYSVAASSGGGAILQRFGTPGVYKVNGKVQEYHTFGLEAGSSIFTAIHNVFYAQSRSGIETITIYVNGIDDSDYSWVYEFELNLVPEAVDTSSDETIWETAYYSAALPWKNGAQGGARPLGMHGKTHVWLVGAPSQGLSVLDESGGFQSYGSTISMYDPFVFVSADSILV